MSVAVRRARPAEADAIGELVERAYARYVPRIGLRPAPMDADYEELISRGMVFVAVEVGRAPVGAIVLAEGDDHLLIENVAVLPERQGTGIGGVLMEFAEREAEARGIPEVRLYTHELMTENLSLYTRLGYRETHRESQRGFARVFLRKRLPGDRGWRARG